MSDKKLGVEQALEFADCTQFDGDPRIGLTLFRNVAGVLGKEVRQLRATVSRLDSRLDFAVDTLDCGWANLRSNLQPKPRPPRKEQVMATCKQCGRAFKYDDEVGYAEDICSPFCDGVLSQQAKIEALRATVSRLPKDADGKPITPGTHRWVTHDDGRAEEVIVEFVGTAAELVVGGLPGTNDECWEEFAADLHSTREAAEAAKE